MVNRNALRSLYPDTSLPTYGGSHSRPGSSRELPGSPPRRTACPHETGKGWPSLTAPQDNTADYGISRDYIYNIATNPHIVKYFFVNLNKHRATPLPFHGGSRGRPGDLKLDACDSRDIPEFPRMRKIKKPAVEAGFLSGGSRHYPWYPPIRMNSNVVKLRMVRCSFWVDG